MITNPTKLSFPYKLDWELLYYLRAFLVYFSKKLGYSCIYTHRWTKVMRQIGTVIYCYLFFDTNQLVLILGICLEKSCKKFICHKRSEKNELVM